MKRIQSLKNTLGPGILFASTAIGVSHLVQSTKACSLDKALRLLSQFWRGWNSLWQVFRTRRRKES